MKKIITMIILMAVGVASYSLVLFDDDFDQSGTNLAGWKRTSTTNVAKNTGSYKNGLASMKVGYNGSVETYINTSMFKDMVLTYKMAKNSLETGEKVVCQYNTSGTWVTAASLLNTATNGTFYSYTVNIPLCSILKIRFVVNGNAADDCGYIDNVKLTGNRK